MTFDVHKILAGAVSGLAAAVLVDIHAWQQSPNAPFNWGLAAQRWLGGAVTGLLAALGIQQAG